MLPDSVTVEAGQLAPEPPEGCAWVFVRASAGRSIELAPVPTEAGTHDPPTPPGCSWRLVKTRGQRVYIAEPQGFAHHPRIPRRGLDD